MSVSLEAIEQDDERFDANLAAHAYSRPVKKKPTPALLGGVLAVVALCGFLAFYFLSGGGPESPSPNTKPGTTAPATGGGASSADPGKTSIAILPFRNIGPAQANTFLADGMHEEIEAMRSIAPSLMVKEASRFTLSPQAKDRAKRGAIWVHPVGGDGRLFLRDQEYIYCYDVKGKAQKGND